MRESIEVLLRIPAPYLKTFNADNGAEFARFKLLEEQLHWRVYFAHPYSAWGAARIEYERPVAKILSERLRLQNHS